MNQVFSNLWIGDANDGRDANALRSHNIKIVVNETNETDSLGGQFEYVRLNQQDGQPILKSTLLLFLTSLCGMRMAHPEGGILIHCGAGVSRILVHDRLAHVLWHELASGRIRHSVRPSADSAASRTEKERAGVFQCLNRSIVNHAARKAARSWAR